MTTSTKYIDNPPESMTNSSLDPSGNPQGAPQGPQTGQPGVNAFNPDGGFAPDPMAREAFRPGGARPDSFGNSRAEGPAPNGPAVMVQRLLKNKIMVGLVLVFLFIFTVGQFYSNSESNNAGPKVAVTPQPMRYPQQSNVQSALRPVAPTVAPPTNGLSPDMAKMFVAWWIGKAMDYSAPTATNSHNEAFTWMTPQAVKAFKESLWSPQIAAGITQGQVSAAFQAVSVQPQAINPDGSIVVTVLGTLMIQEANNPTPASQQIVVDFLVKKDTSGNCRVSGLYNRTTR